MSEDGDGRKARGQPEPSDLHEAFEDFLKVDDRFYILATSAMADDRPRVLKQGETFAVFDHFGDVRPVGLAEEGLYHEGTRYLSALVLRLGDVRPLFLSSTVREDNALLTVDLTNPDLLGAGGESIPRGSVHLLRTKFLWQGACYERLRLRNFGLEPVRLPLTLHFAADYADVFEVRGMPRERRGRQLDPAVDRNGVTFRYDGLDGVARRTRVLLAPPAAAVGESEARFDVDLSPGGEVTLHVTISCETGTPGDRAGTGRPPGHDHALRASQEHRARLAGRACRIRTSNTQFNAWIGRSLADLDMLATDTGDGLYPYAGIPWYSTVFGRDGLITAYECLWNDPDLARGVLQHLAAHQATETVPERDAEPGKILHETRKGEMAALGEIPFGLYYGSVDSTPLFVLLAGAYYRRSGDREFLRWVWPHVEAALGWIDDHGDLDGDGFVEYWRRTAEGLVNQGWKDSNDAVFHADGSLAEGPVALAEVQAYVYAARIAAADLADALGHPERAGALLLQADHLRIRFEDAFWCEDLGTYALALDGRKEPCRVRTSNAGHVLFGGASDRERARRTADALMSPDSFSGWGIRTVAAGQARYNPMSYHDGSVWPHDNAVIAHGFARYGFKAEALRVLTGLFEASLHVDLHRMPELFCGFDRRPDSSPTLYPVACAPQAWAAAAPFLLLQSCLGLDLDAPRRRVCFRRPLLPEFLDEIEIRDLRLADASLDLRLRRREDDVRVDLLRRDGDVELVIVK